MASSKNTEPNAVVGRSAGGGFQFTWAANASSVVQTPPPAAETAIRQSPGAQAGSSARAVTRPDSCVAGPVSVSGSKNCEGSPGTFGVNGPSSVHDPSATACALAPERSCPDESFEGTRSNARSVFTARRSST